MAKLCYWFWWKKLLPAGRLDAERARIKKT
jgi:hypothetical protein